MGNCGTKKPPPKSGNIAKAPNLKELEALPPCSVDDEILGLHVMHGGPSNGCQILLYIARALKGGDEKIKTKYLYEIKDKQKVEIVSDDVWTILEYCGFEPRHENPGEKIRRVTVKTDEIQAVLKHIAAVAGSEELSEEVGDA
eukprot:TRINITY_DN12647_c0_g1_i1.p1 TRINITY_DN12647_c0_g1~~TRINITY_DN12647_c0_g1_i1.p1  ORF type:complete len:157 (+),score=44.00 TRINITY_DN12647_c0_g1_i1:45-473(+)